jgi:hypothetical protein
MGCGQSTEQDPQQATERAGTTTPQAGAVRGGDARAKQHTLDLSDQHLSVLPEVSSGVPPRRIVAANNLLSRFPRDVKAWVGVSEIDLTGNRFAKVPNTLGSLPKLTTIILASNPFGRTSVFDSMPDLHRVQILDVSNCGLKTLGAALFAKSGLTSLDVSRNAGLDIRSSPFGRMSKLTTLNLAECGLTVIGTLRQSRTVTHLDISGNPRLDMNDARGLGALGGAVKVLDARAMGWQDVPRAVCEMAELQTLVLRQNPLETLSGLGFLSATLRKLDISACSLAALPHGSDELAELTHLDVSGNPLTSLAELADYAALHALTCTGCPWTAPSGSRAHHRMWGDVARCLTLRELTWDAAPVSQRVPLQLGMLPLRKINGNAIAAPSSGVADMIRSGVLAPTLWQPTATMDVTLAVLRRVAAVETQVLNGADAATVRYLFFLYLSGVGDAPLVPPPDVAAMHLAHLSDPVAFIAATDGFFGRVVDAHYWAANDDGLVDKKDEQRRAAWDARVEDASDDPVVVALLAYDYCTNPLAVEAAAGAVAVGQRQLGMLSIDAAAFVVPMRQLERLFAFAKKCGDLAYAESLKQTATRARYVQWLTVCAEIGVEAYAPPDVLLALLMHKAVPAAFVADMRLLGVGNAALPVTAAGSGASYDATCGKWREMYGTELD